MANAASWLEAATAQDIAKVRRTLIEAALILRNACPDIDDVSSVSLSSDHRFAIFAAGSRFGRPRFETVEIGAARVLEDDPGEAAGDASAWLTFSGETLTRVVG